MVINIGFDIPVPEKECQDKKCPFHAGLAVRGRMQRVKVVSTGMVNSAVVQREFRRFNKKYERYTKSISKYHVHLPGCIEVEDGEDVFIVECRKLSKTVSHVIIGKVQK
ncbi:MAG: 30S ribosomal protein S17 [Candidatus Thermoplasmatota archaeon]|nr:30S ribosomal protein S17 [Candidatus Thermoplasmatota archaeon]